MDITRKSPKVVPAGEFKQGCLAILDAVDELHCEYVITKRGRAVARLVPVEPATAREEQILRDLRGHGRMTVTEEEFLRPTVEEWDEDRELP